MISVEEWDTRYWQIYNDALIDRDDGTSGGGVDKVAVLAEQECTEQFGPRPEETP